MINKMIDVYLNLRVENLSLVSIAQVKFHSPVFCGFLKDYSKNGALIRKMDINDCVIYRFITFDQTIQKIIGFFEAIQLN